MEATTTVRTLDTSIHGTKLDRSRPGMGEQRAPSSGHNDMHPLIPTRNKDKYGNSLSMGSCWVVVGIWQSAPAPSRKYYYSSREKYSGYRVSSNFLELGSRNGNGGKMRNDDNFDSLHDNDLSRMLNQFQGSLSAHAYLHDFTNEKFARRIALPSWASSSTTAAGVFYETVMKKL
ncbi:hypothetical protein ACHAW5_001573 [Stephanodiscus triporus]|uniref:Uncharacterized protein n=1 Tax=Stephanodiscus triporus TaxID=2934178 RepID=A0ABD3NHW7_9STRA